MPLFQPKPPVPEIEAPDPQWLSRVLKKRIVVHTRDDKSIQGVLMEQLADGVILRAALLLRDGSAPPTPMAGETWIPRENVAFAQLDE
jgi:hypothetical protein